MLIELTCPGCGAMFKLNPEVAGPKWNCGNCGGSIPVPRESISTSATQTSPESNALPALSVGEVVSWETFRVATCIASWSGIAGVIGSLSYGLGTILLQTWIANLAAPQPAFMPFQLYFECALIGMIAIGLAFSFAMASAGVCRVSRVASDSIEWGITALFAFALSIAMVLAIPLLFNGLGEDANVANLVLKGIVLLMVFGVLAGHACLATGFGRTATRLGRSGVQFSTALYCCLLFGLSVWTVLNVFVFTGGNVLTGDPFLGGMDLGWVNLVVSTFATAAHYYWFGRIARQTRDAVRNRQISIA